MYSVTVSWVASPGASITYSPGSSPVSSGGSRSAGMCMSGVCGGASVDENFQNPVPVVGVGTRGPWAGPGYTWTMDLGPAE